MDNVRTVNRREALSGKVSYGDPIVIRDSSRSRIQFVPFFVPRSDGTELALKVVTYRKNSPPSDWVLVPENSLSLNESEGRQLLAALRDHLAVAQSDQDGRYILIRVNEGTANIGDNDPASVASALAKVLSQDEIVQHLAATELTDSLLSAFRGAIRLKEMRSAVAELRKLLDSDEANEQLYQTWCKQHSWAFGNAYVMSDDVRDIRLATPLIFSCPLSSPATETSLNSNGLIARSCSTTAFTETSSFRHLYHAPLGRCIVTWTVSKMSPQMDF